MSTFTPTANEDNHDQQQYSGTNALISELEMQLSNEADYRAALRRIWDRRSTLHLAVMSEPFLTYVLQGKKSVESRFSEKRVAPYGRVDAGDLLLFKRSAGAVLAAAIVTAVQQFRLDESAWELIWTRYGDALCASEAFLSTRTEAVYATLMTFCRVRTLQEIAIDKRDRRGWVVLSECERQLDLL